MLHPRLTSNAVFPPGPLTSSPFNFKPGIFKKTLNILPFEPFSFLQSTFKRYGMFQDVHVMIFIGFGFLMTFLRKYAYSSISLNMFIAVIVIQWYPLVSHFWHSVIVKSKFTNIHFDVGRFTLSVSLSLTHTPHVLSLFLFIFFFLFPSAFALYPAPSFLHSFAYSPVFLSSSAPSLSFFPPVAFFVHRSLSFLLSFPALYFFLFFVPVFSPFILLLLFFFFFLSSSSPLSLFRQLFFVYDD